MFKVLIQVVHINKCQIAQTTWQGVQLTPAFAVIAINTTQYEHKGPLSYFCYAIKPSKIHQP